MILLLDIDGTLVDHRTDLPDSAAQAVRKARTNGHGIYLCTGRAKAEIYPHLWDLGIDGLIGGNGSYVESGGEVLHHQVLDAAVVTRAVDWLLVNGYEFYLECNHALYGTGGLPVAIAALADGGPTPENIEWARNTFPGMVYGAIADADEGVPWRTDCNKISFVLRPGTDLEALAADFAGDAGIDSWSATGKGPEFGEIGQLGVHKGAAVELLAAHLGASKDDLIGFGDARSDIELLRACGTGVAMGQAPEQLKAVATLVTDSVDDDGLANAFAKLGLI